MDSGTSRTDEDKTRYDRRAQLKALNLRTAGTSHPTSSIADSAYSLPYSQEPNKALDSSLKRHTALIKRIRQSIGHDNRDQILKDIETLSLEKYIEEIAGAVPEGIGRCKVDKDVWSAVEVRPLDGTFSTTRP
jgi:regulator of nonsense transcripts 2